MTIHTSEKTTKLTGTITVPGDKSISHRALILASQVLGTTTINGLLEGEDVIATANALRSMGVDIQQSGEQWVVRGVGIGGLHAPDDIVDCGNSGTSARLLMGLAAPYAFTSFFTGDASLRMRPMGRVIRPLEKMGVSFQHNDTEKLPLAVLGSAELLPMRYELPVASAQVKSAILLAALNTMGRSTVIEPTATRDHTEKMLRYFGIAIDVDADGIHLDGQQAQHYKDHDFTVPADPSSAAFAVVAALICSGSELMITNVCMNPQRIGLFTTLIEMGADIRYENERQVAGEDVADICVRHSQLRGVEVPASRAASMIDEYPILAVAAAFAEGDTIMRSLGELRVKESNRLAAIEGGLQACGVSVAVDGDDLTVTGSSQVAGGATITTNLDHRICMAFLVMGMASQQPVAIDSAEPIATSFPNFIALFNDLGANIKADGSHAPMVIAVDGQAASGKGTLARRLADHFGLQYLDTGSLYRAVGRKLLNAGDAPEDEAAATRIAQSITIHDLASPKLRQEVVGNAASIVSAYPGVRAALLNFQRQTAASEQGAVLDGRDIGTVVCPNADVKFYLTASMDARAGRRHKELSGQGIEVVYDSVYEDLKERDERDAAREIAPMKPADDALALDTSDMSTDDVFYWALRHIDQKQSAQAGKKVGE